MVLREVETGEILAAANINETNLITFSEWILQWLIDYSNLTLIIERRSTGSTIIDYLLIYLVSRNINPFKRIYNKVVQEYEEYPDRYDEVNRASTYDLNNLVVKYKKTFGFATSAVGATSRSDLYGSSLQNSAKYTATLVNDMVLAKQILGLIIKNGRVDHPEGEHDDLCISWLLSYWLLSKGKKLDYYGINSNNILTKNLIRNNTHVALDDYDQAEQDYIENAINDVIETIKKERDIFITQKLEFKLKNLYNSYKNKNSDIISIDQLLSDIREYKKHNNRIQTSSSNNNSWYSSRSNR
jgi:hypothetical protein